MKLLPLVLFLLAFQNISRAQFDLRASMGIDFTNTPSLNDYLNRYFAPPGEEIPDFNSAVIFSVEGGYFVTESYQVGVELAYSINSYNSSGTLGRYDFSYYQIMPSVTGYYVISGEGYNFKLGAGAGLRIVNADETLPGTVGSQSYSASGFGFLLRADGNTALGKNIYANIGTDVKLNYPGELKSGDFSIGNRIITETVSMNSLSIGLHLGITFQF